MADAAPQGAPIAGRLTFLDGLRGVALIFMVVNHTSRDWTAVGMGWSRYHLVYGSLLLPASIFLFLVGFCLPISYHRHRRSQGFVGDARRYVRRGIGIVAAGYLLNVILLLGSPGLEGSVLHGGVLQTIGLCIMLLGPMLPLLRSRAWRWALLALAVLVYLSYGWLHDSLEAWNAAHPLAGIMIFGDFPPWPWLAAALVGLVLGWAWLEARARGAQKERRYFAATAVIGVLFVAAYAVGMSWYPTVPRFGFVRDLRFGLNQYWTPRGVTVLGIIGGTAILLALCYWLMEARGWRAPWLVTLGQTALVLYFAHQVIEEIIVHRWLGFELHGGEALERDWIIYWTANVALIALCVYMGRAWQAIKPRVRSAVGLSTA